MSDLVVFARNAAEMQTARTGLAEWCAAKLHEAESELEDMNENLAIAKRSKWRTSGLTTATNRAKKRCEFYEKLKVAVDAGYVIVPDFPIDIFAVRTERKYPIENYISARHDGPRRVESESPPLGSGENVSRTPEVRMSPDGQIANQSGSLVNVNTYWSSGFKDVDFPVKTVRPVILDETSKALQLKVFDEVGIIGAGKQKRQVFQGQVAGADPMVIGRVIYRRPSGDKRINFLIAWWLNAADLVV